MKLKNILAMVGLVGILLVGGHAAPAQAGIEVKRSFVVNSIDDKPDAKPGDGKCKTAAKKCTLRAAVQEANAVQGHDSIYLKPAIYSLALTGSEDKAKKGDLDILDSLTIQGVGSDKTWISGKNIDRVFHVKTDGIFLLRNLTVLSGNAGTGVGGGIYNERGVLALLYTKVLDSYADRGGGIYNNWISMVYYSTLSNNDATTSGGGIYSTATAKDTQLVYAALDNNGARNYGGGIYNEGEKLEVYASTLASNYADANGGGLYNTWSGATPNNVDVVFSTIAKNTADADAQGSGGGGGLVNLSNGHIKLTDTIVADNHDNTPGEGNHTEDCYGAFESGGNNLLGISDSCTGLQNGVKGDKVGSAATPLDPQLGPLAYNGGPTRSIMPNSASPAIDASGSDMCDSGTPFLDDQRGRKRLFGAKCDIGANELYAICAEPYTPSLTSPIANRKVKNNLVTFEWLPIECAEDYNVVIRENSDSGPVVVDTDNITETTFSTLLTPGKKYYWKVYSCNSQGCNDSEQSMFKIKK